MARRGAHSPGWFLAALGIAAALAYATFVGSLLNSCGVALGVIATGLIWTLEP